MDRLVTSGFHRFACSEEFKVCDMSILRVDTMSDSEDEHPARNIIEDRFIKVIDLSYK